VGGNDTTALEKKVEVRKSSLLKNRKEKSALLIVILQHEEERLDSPKVYRDGRTTNGKVGGKYS